MESFQPAAEIKIPRMLILLGQSAVYPPNFGGASKANRLFLEILAAAGHRCFAVVPANGTQSESDLCAILQDLGVPYSFEGPIIRYNIQGVAVRAATSQQSMEKEFASLIASCKPDRILVSTEDFAQRFLRLAVGYDSRKVIYLAHTTQLLPFGPAAFWPNDRGHQLVLKVGQIFGVSKFLCDYIHKHGGRPATHLRLPIAEPMPLNDPGRGTFVLMINPCAIKGISLFIAIASRLPEVSFAAVPSWGTTNEDMKALSELSNIRIMLASQSVEHLYSQAKLLLVPSLWDEAFGLVVIEAMLRRIPVLASDAGGLREAKLGVRYTLPVSSIREYKAELDEKNIPVPVIPGQLVGPWIQTIKSLLADDHLYQEVSLESYHAASDFVRTLDSKRLERAFTSPEQQVIL